jgi:hypothetical protein
MHGTLVYSNTGISSTNGVVSIGQHTSCVKLWNQNTGTTAAVKFNGQYIVAIPHTSDGGPHVYHEICGDYTTLEILTAGCTISVIALG